MHVIALPGHRIETGAWMRDLLVAAGLPADRVVRYRHWEMKTDVSIPFEASRLVAQVPDLVVAKSLGTVVAATAFANVQFRPRAATLIGTPYLGLSRPARRLLQQFAEGVRTLLIQQADDPGGSVAEPPAALRLSAAEATAVPGSDHLYSDTTGIGALFKRWNQEHR